MKFFRQTKETKRKLSFFMALAMVISLLPVSPVAKAATKSTGEANVYVNCVATGASFKSVEPVIENEKVVSGSALITLNTKGDYTFDKNSSIKVEVTTSGSIISTANSCTVAAVSNTAITDNSQVKVDNPVYSGATCTIKITNIYNNIRVDIKGTATAKKTPTEPTDSTEPTDPDPAEYSVTFDDTAFNYGDISLTYNQKLSTGGAITLPANTVIKFTITAKGNNAKFNVLPVLKSNDTVVDWAGTTTRTATVTITKDTKISITGGTVVVVAITDDNNTTGDTVIPDADLKEDLGEVKISELPVDDVVTNITASAITMEDGTEVTPEIVEQILASLADENTKISTSLKVDKATSNAITEANTAVSNSTDFGSDAASLGENAIKEKVQAMMAREDSVALDITLNSVITMMKDGEAATKASISVKSLGKEIEITMNKPKSLNEKDVDGTYYAIRIHDGKATVIKCTYDKLTKKLTFKSDKFSTYVISFVPSSDGSGDDKPDNPGDDKPSNPSGGGIGGYVPTTSATPAPSATAAPSASPSADPSATPGADSSAAPAESGTPAPGDGDTTPTKAPTATDKPVDTDKDNTTGGSTAVKVGKKATVSGSQYKVTAVKGTRTVQFTKGKKNAKSIVVPSTVKISGKNYKVTTIAKNAFKGNKKLAKVTIGKNVNKIGVSAFQNCSKLKSIIIKSTKLTAKKVGKNAFKGINKKATFKVPKSKVKAYKKIVKAKGAGKNVKVKK